MSEGIFFKSSESSDNLSTSPLPVSDEPADEIGFPSEIVGSHDATTSLPPFLPPRDHSHHEIPSAVHISPAVELPDGIRVPPETVSSRDAAVCPFPSFPPEAPPILK
jgi:hypothetical protein